MIGFIIGAFVGVILCVVIMALLSFHKLTEYEEEILKLRRRVAEAAQSRGIGGEGMREILFRGKTHNDKWVQGLLVQMDNRLTQIRKLGSDGIGYYDYSIVPSTVGQYTGLTDKNGKKIFEGDILMSCGKTLLAVYSDTRAGFVVVDKNNVVYPRLKQAADIGNIHDNPELLEVTE